MKYISSEDIGFNPAPPTWMCVDINSCFATIEQQANPRLRGKSVAVAAYTTSNGCILAASYEAKAKGVATGMPVWQGKMLEPDLIVMSPDPDKYRYVSRKLVSILESLSPDVEVKSIDEMIVDFARTPIFRACSMSESEDHTGRQKRMRTKDTMERVAMRIKSQIQEDIGSWITVSIGIAPNRYLSKLASGLQKPDGLVTIMKENIRDILGTLALEELVGIKKGYGNRLRCHGINSTHRMYDAPIARLRQAFNSVIGYHWWLRLHGWEADDRRFATKSFGHSHALGVPYTPRDTQLHQVVSQLVCKMGRRLRRDRYIAENVGVSCFYRDGSFWQRGKKQTSALYADRDLYTAVMRLLREAPDKPLRIIAVRCFELSRDDAYQMNLFEDDTKKRSLTYAIDDIHARWGEMLVKPGRMLGMKKPVLDRISFGNARGMSEITLTP